MKLSQSITQTSQNKEACNPEFSACGGSHLPQNPTAPQCDPAQGTFLFDGNFLSNKNELCCLLEELCAIPAPSGQEDLRVSFISQWLFRLGLHPIIDTAKNVLVPFHCETSSRITLLMAHTDTVFPDTKTLPVKCTRERIYSPGVGDNTACVAILMLFIKHHLQALLSSSVPLLFAFNSCEEGLGNLKGCRQIMETYQGRICQVISFDGGVNGICNHAVGSLRYEISIRTKGGHSYNDFGNDNAIEAMALLIQKLYQLKVPAHSKSTYNVGTIQGGTSVNTIAQGCKCLVEYRSDKKEHLEQMNEYFSRTVESLKRERPKLTLEVTLVGERPCMGEVDPKAQEALTLLASKALAVYSRHPLPIGPGSTDCNIPLSLGIPAISFGGLLGGGVHTREEYVNISEFLDMEKVWETFSYSLCCI